MASGKNIIRKKVNKCYILRKFTKRNIVKLGRQLLLVLVSWKNSRVALRQSLQRATVDMAMEEGPETKVHSQADIVIEDLEQLEL